MAARDGAGSHTRLRWQAERPGALWHGDVCHGPALKICDKTLPLRIHGMLDDASRYVVALEAMHSERELDMIGLLARVRAPAQLARRHDRIHRRHRLAARPGLSRGRVVTAHRCLVEPDAAPWVEYEGKRLELRGVDPVKNARTKREPRRPGAPGASYPSNQRTAYLTSSR